jgi:hypothetical protein
MATRDLEFADKVLGETDDLGAFADELQHVNDSLPARINADSSGVERGLAKLGLTLIELVRRLLERQALHRIENGTLSEEEIERLGDTFLRLATRMEELKVAFDLEGEELNLHLGSLGDLM